MLAPLRPEWGGAGGGAVRCLEPRAISVLNQIDATS